MAARASRSSTTGTRCPSCRVRILSGWDGHRAALHVTADLTPLTPEEEAQVREDPNRLTWCLRTTQWSPPRLAWISPSVHPPDCPHDHVTDHRCPTRTLF